MLLLISNGFQQIDSTVVVANDDALQVMDDCDLFSFFQEYSVHVVTSTRQYRAIYEHFLLQFQ